LYTLGITRSAQEDEKKKIKVTRRGERKQKTTRQGGEEEGFLHNSSVSRVMQPQLR